MMIILRLLVSMALSAAVAAGSWLVYSAMALPQRLSLQLAALFGGACLVVFSAAVIRRDGDGALAPWQQRLIKTIPAPAPVAAEPEPIQIDLTQHAMPPVASAASASERETASV